MNSEHWIVNIDPFMVHFPANFPIAGIKWYGLCYVVCFFLILFMLNLYSRKNISTLSKHDNESLIWHFALGIIAGGRIGYELLYQFDVFSRNPLNIFYIWKGGMSSHGGFIGAVISIIIYSKKHKHNTFAIADLLCATIPICLFLGRCCNFINAELVGKISNVQWAVIFIRSGHLLPRHPSQLYEAASEGLLLFCALQYLLFKQHRDHKQIVHGKISSLFLVFYSLIRIICEIFREPDAPLIFNISRGQFYSVFTLLAGIFLFVYIIKKQNQQIKHKKIE